MRLFIALFFSVSIFLNFGLTSPVHAVVSQEQASVLDISVQSIEGRIAATITFSAPVKGDIALDQWLIIVDESGSKVTGSWVLDDAAKVLYFTNIEPERRYLVSVKKGLPLINRGFLSQGKSQKISVDPISPMLGFAGNGNLLADSLVDGLPVISVNVGQVDVDFYRIPEKELVAFLSGNTRRGQQDFWKIESYINRLDLVYTARFDLKLFKNQTATSYLPIKEIAPLQRQGVYLAIMRKSGEYNYSHPSTWFASSDLGVHLRIYPDRADVSVNSLETAAPIKGVKLRLLDANAKLLDTRYTDETGAAHFSQSALEKANLLLATKGEHTSVVRLFGPVLDLSEFPVSGNINSPQQLFMYSERDLYRPGEAITLSALLRDKDGNLMPPQVLTFKLKQPDGRIASVQRIQPNTLGYYASVWQLPKDGATGKWSISSQIPGQASNHYNLQIEEFLPERMELTLNASEYLNTLDTFDIAVAGNYLYGAPAANNILQTQLLTHSAPHPFKAFEKFHFSNPQITEFNRRNSLDDQALNADGALQVTPKNYWRTAKTPLQLKLYTSLLDSGGRPVSRAINSYALPAEKMVGIRPLFDEDTAPYDSPANFEIILSEGQKKLAAANLQVKLIREQRNYHWLYTPNEGWTSDYTERHYTVSTTTISVKEGQAAAVSLAVDWGHYRIEVSNPETRLVTGYKFRAGWSADETVMTGRPDRVGLAFNKQRYKAGDQVVVEIKPPAAGKGYLLVESATALLRQIVDIPAQGGQVSFTVQEQWNSHDLYVSVLLIQPGRDREEKLPRRMMGIAPLLLDREARKLKVVIESPAKIRPNTELTIPIKVSFAGSAPKGRVQVTLAAVDVGVLNISKFVTPDPFDGFFQQRAYSVSARDSYSDLINADKGVRAQLKFGGDSDTSQAGEADPDVQIVSLFSGVVNVDAQGNAQVKLTIPDFSGRLRLMAVGFTEQHFGSVDKEIEVADPVVAQLTKPRFLRPGDTSQLALDLNNLSAVDQQMDLQLTLADGLSFSRADHDGKQQQKRSVSLDKGEKKVLYFPIEAAANYRAVDIDLNLTKVTLGPTVLAQPKKTLSLTRHWQLTVKPAWAITHKQWQTALSSGEKLSIAANEFDHLITKGLSGRLNVSSQPPLDIASNLRALEAYPYGCLEQTTSGVFPQLYINDALLAELAISGSDAASRNKAINLAIQRLQTMQRGSGGFGLWSDRSHEEHWLTVYVVDFLLRAKALGYQVPADNLAKALKRITIYLRSPDKIRSYYEEVNKTTKFAVRAYAAQVLSRSNQAPLSILRHLYDHKNADDTPMALLQLGIALNQAGDKTRADKALAEAVSRIERFGSEHLYYSSAVRDLALSSFWLLESKLKIENDQRLLLSLIAHLKEREWLSTQERNALFLLGKELHKADGTQSGKTDGTQLGKADGSVRLSWQVNAERFEQQLDRLQLILDSDDLQHDLAVQNHGEQTLFVNMRAEGYAKQAPRALDQGIDVKRKYFTLTGESFQKDSIRSGEKLIVELTVLADQRLRHAMIVDLLPAGLEIENQNLADSYDQSQLKVGGTSISESMYNLSIQYQQYRDDRFVMALELPRNNKVKLYYLVRAVSAGRYQIPPTFAEDMYRPEIRHRGRGGSILNVLPR